MKIKPKTRQRILLASLLTLLVVFFAWNRTNDIFLAPEVGAAACPIIDGGVGDDDASANGVITISTSKAFAAITGEYDCTATAFLITSTGTLLLDGNGATGQTAAVRFGSLTIDNGGSLHANAEGCAAGVVYYGYGPNSSNVCAQDTGGSYNTYSGGSANTAGAGGGHGGAGGHHSAGTGTGGPTYGSATAPAFFGSSGGGANGSQFGGTGGGIVRITVTGTFVNNGTVSANGNPGVADTSGRATGGGSGGSIYVTAGTVEGSTGLFEAKGGNGGASTAFAGGGGGGRIAIYTGGGSFAFGAGNLDVSAGAAGGGTARNGTKGTVYVKNTTTNAVTIYHGFTFDDTDHFVSSWTVDPSATNQNCDPGMSTGATPSVHASGAVALSGAVACTTVMTIGTGTISSTGTAVTGSGTSFTSQVGVGDAIIIGGETRFVTSVISATSLFVDGAFSPDLPAGTRFKYASSSITSLTFDGASTLSIANGSSIKTYGGMFFNGGTGFSIGTGVTISATKINGDLEFNVPSGSSQTWDSLTVNVGPEGEFITDDAFNLTLQNGTAINASVRWTNLSSLTQNAGTSISANAKGCVASTNWTNGPNSSNVCVQITDVAVYGLGSGGTGHGGAGGAGSTSPGRGTYDSATAPVLFGSSGGSTNQSITNGGDGGGVVRIVVTGTFTHNGTISADGEAGLTNGTAAAAGGAGGSIYITAGTLNSSNGVGARLLARGGNGADSTNDGGGGGGGRISLSHKSGTFTVDSTDFDVSGGTVTGAATPGTKGTVYVKNTTTNAVSIYHGFSFDNTNHFVSSWTVDTTATNQYCEPGASIPAIHSTGPITLAGTMSCTTAITSFTADAATSLTISDSSSITINGGIFFTGGTGLAMGTGVGITNTRTDYNIEFNIGAGSSTTWDSLTLTVAPEGEFITDDAFNLTLQNGTAINGSVRWTNLASLTQNFGTTINADAKGCVASTNWSNIPNGSNVCVQTTDVAVYGLGSGGTGHGGAGGAGSTSPGRGTYDSATAPVLFGSSGGSTNQSITNGGDGGGVVRISVVGTFTANGTISADGEAGLTNGTAAAAGGAGGSVYITTGTLNGTVSASGGNGADSTNDGGGGGGGRISLSHGGGTFTVDSTDFDVSGGAAAGAATPGTKGTVYVKNTATNAVTVYHGFTFHDTDHFVSSWTADPSATNQYCDTALSASATPSVHATGAISMNGVLNCSTSIASFEMDAATSLTFVSSSSVAVNGAAFFSAGATFTVGENVSVSTTKVNSDLEFNIPSGGSQTWTDFTASVAPEGEFIIDDSFALTLANNDGPNTSINGSVRWTDLASLTQNSGTSINANARGCVATTNWSNVPNGSNVCAQTTDVAVFGNGAGGTGHGGAGGAGSTSPGRGTYDSATAPVLFGSSGGSTNQSIANGGDGGGVVRIVTTGTFTHNGTISADGENGLPNGATAAGGAAGGSIYLTAATYDCSSGTFSAKGGNGADGSSNDGGGGGGGRFSVEYGSDTSIGCPLSGLTAASVTPGGTVTGTATAGTNGTINLTSPVPTPGACPFADNDAGDNDPTVGIYEWNSDQTFTAQAATYDCTSPATFRIVNGRTITLDGNASGVYAKVDFTNLVINTTGKLTADSQGCAGGPNHVRFPNSSNVCVDHGGTTYGLGSGGGGHGGTGGKGSTVPDGGGTNDSATAPVLYGSAGGGNNTGTNGVAGGGVVRIDVSGTLTHNGTISANGNNGVISGTTGTGGGAGGSIYVTAGTINGTTGVFEAKGGNGADSTNDGGGGGGGRIAIHYNATGSGFGFTATNLDVAAGTASGTAVAGTKGTVFVNDDNGTRGSLIDDDITIFHGYTFIDTDLSVNSWTADVGATNQYCDSTISSSATPSLSALTITHDGTLNCVQTLSSFGYFAAGTLTLASSSQFTVNAALTLSAVTDFSVGTGVTVTQNKTNGDIVFDIPAGDDQTWTDLAVNGPAEGDFIVDDAIAITLSSVTGPVEAIAANVRFTNLTSFTQNANTSIDASTKGCAGGPNHVMIPNGSNVCGNHGGTTYGLGSGGGGHGGAGGKGSTVPDGGSTYDSAVAPVLYGSAGGGNNAGTNGVNAGGLVRINASGAVVLNGTIAANGNNGVISGTTGTGGGAGGSIYISTTGALSGSIATIFAKGGDGANSTNDGGGGGGGRISLVYGSTTLPLAAGLFDVSAGTASGTAVAGTKGTVFVQDMANTPNGSGDDVIRIYHGFTFADVDFSVTSWLVDPSATNQYCSTASSTSSVSAVTITLDGAMNCTVAISSLTYAASGPLMLMAGASMSVNGPLTLSAATTLTVGNGASIGSAGRLSLSAGGSFVMGSSVTVTNTGTNTDIDFNIPAGNDQTWTDLTVNGPPEGDFIVDDAIAITLTSVTVPVEEIAANVRFTNLTSFTQNTGTSVNADTKGCAGGPNHVMIPNGSNSCGNHGGTTYGLGSGGGGHGGAGGKGSTVPDGGSTYDSAVAPVLYGSSGGGTNAGTNGVNGGGLVRVNATGPIILNGTVSANGVNGTIAGANGTGGSAGGSVYISTTGALSGSIATIFAAGGDGANSTNDGGGGGGGRISLVYGSTTLPLAAGLFDVSAGTASGTAVAGGIGTVFVNQIGTNQFVYNDDVIRVYHGFTYTDFDWTVISWIIEPGASQSCDSTMGTGATPSVTATNAITFNGTLNCAPSATRISSFVWSSPAGVSMSASTTMNIKGNLTMTSSAGPITIGDNAVIATTTTDTAAGSITLSAATTFTLGTGITVTSVSTNSDINFNIPAGINQTWSDLEVNGPAEGDLIVDDAVGITLTAGTILNTNVRFTNLTAFTQDAGTTINANAKGCAGQAAYSLVPTSSNVCSTLSGIYGNGAGGGGHGGTGGAGSTAVGGYTYGSATVPVLYGSSGGGGNSTPIGADGGGLVRINATGPIVLSGTISADGAVGINDGGSKASGGGAGGSIYIATSGALSGSIATFSAKGGAGGDAGVSNPDAANEGGGGAGGRIALSYGSTTLTPAAGLFDVAGGTAADTATAGVRGTVYMQDTANTAGVTTDDIIRIYHGFTFADTDHNVSQWLIDASATNQYCDTGLGSGATPSVTAANTVTFRGAMNCVPTNTITSFTWTSTGGYAFDTGASMTVKGGLVINPPTGSVTIGNSATVSSNVGGTAGGTLTVNSPAALTVGNSVTVKSYGNMLLSASSTFSLGSSVTVTDDSVNTDITFNILAGNNQTWSGLTVNTPPEGDFIIDDAIGVTFSSGTIVNGNVRFTNLTSFTQDVGTTINADFKGCMGQAAYSIVPTGSNVCSTLNGLYGNGAAGGGHGGNGGAGSTVTPGGYTYGSATVPVLYGSSGGGGNSTPIGGDGGGLVRINASGAVTLNGTITANGGSGGVASPRASGGGAGGSIYITAGNLTGTPAAALSAKGGAGGDSTNDGGGGAGGRVAILYSSTTIPISAATVDVSGGAAFGTAVAGQKGTTFVNNIAANTVQIFHGFTFADVDHNVATWTIDASATNQYCDRNLGTGATPSVTATNPIIFNGAMDCSPLATRIASFTWSSPGGVSTSASTTMNVKGGLVMTSSGGPISIGDGATISSSTTDVAAGTMTLSAGSTFSLGIGSTVTTNSLNSDVNFNIVPGDDQVWDNVTINIPGEGDLVVDDSVAITLQNGTDINGNVRFTNLTNFTQNSGTTINADFKGCDGQPAYGVSPNGSNVCNVNNVIYGPGAGGGGHGGAGGAGSTAAGGGTYDSATAPVLYGMSGGGGNSVPVGPDGGGLVRIVASGTFTHDGAISANGNNGTTSGTSASGGAAGGSIYISASTYVCTTGTFSAAGGNGGNSTNDGGGGGGGRLAVGYNTDSSVGCTLASLAAATVVPGGTATGTATAGSTGSLSLNAGNPVPAISNISPTSRAVGSGVFTLTVNGSNFVAGSVVRWNGADRTTTFVNATQVTASIPASDQTTAGTFPITVFNPAPAGGLSNAVNFDVTNPAPTTTSISPNNKNVGETGFTLTVNGTNFVSTSVVRFAGSDRATTFVNSTQVTASIPASDLLVGGNFDITVFNAAPGGGTSNAQTFTVGNPIPTTTNISPTGKDMNDPEFTLTVNGTNFVSTSVVRFAGSDRATTFVNTTQLTAIIPASDLTAAGTFTITVFNPAPGGGTSNGQTFTVGNPVPTTTSISPTSKTTGDAGFTLTVNGTNFVSTSVVRWDGSDRTTTFVNATQLTATIPVTDLDLGGEFAVTVFNPAPSGGTSNGQTFTVNNPAPTATSLSPSTRTANSGAFTLTVNGTNFVANSVVRFAGSDRATTFVNSTQVTAYIPNSDIAANGSFAITVFNPAPNGGESNTQTLTVQNPVPTTTSISPTYKDPGSIAFTLTVNGTNFMPTSVVRFNGSDRTTTYASATQLTADIPATDLTLAGTFPITVFNPAPGGGTSNSQNFIVGNPVPVTTSITPNSKMLNDAGFTMTVDGSDFVSSSIVRFNGSNRATTFVNSTQLTATIPVTDMTAAGTFTITVFNPAPVGGTSNGQTFTVNNPTPTTTNIVPTSKNVGDIAFTLTVNGTNFLTSSVVRFNGSNRTTTFVSDTQLTATIPATDLTTAGTFPITVFNPSPGGGSSNSQTLTVNNLVPTTSSIAPTGKPTAAPGFTLTVNGNNFVSTSVVRFNGSDRVTTFVAATQLTATIPASDLLTPGLYPITVFNPAPGGGVSNAQTFTVGATTDPTLSNSITLSRLKAGAAATVAIRFTLQNTLSGPLTVTFPAGFTVTGAATVGASSACLSGFGFTSSTLFATKTNCSGTITLAGATVTNPVTPGVYDITWVNDDPGGGSVIITSNDQEEITASIDPTITFNVGSQAAATACDGTFAGNGGTVAFGVLSNAGVTTSDTGGIAHICARVTTNASSGAVVQIRSLNGALASGSVPADVIPSATGTLSAGVAGYGTCVGSSVGDVGKDVTVPPGATPVASAPFNGSCDASNHAIGGLTTSYQNLWSISGPSLNAYARIFLKASAALTTPGHNDYADTLFFVATGTY